MCNRLKILLQNAHRTQFFILLLAIAALVLALRHSFVQDDAYISFQYARNLANGNGLNWYPGLHEYGYTSFLFTVCIAGLMKLGFAPETAAFILSIPAFAGAIVLVFLLASTLSRRVYAPYVASIAVVANYTMFSYATGGLETAVHMFLILLTYCFVIWYHKGLYGISAWHIGVTASLALLCRLDSILLILPAYLYLAAHFYPRLRSGGVTNPTLRIPVMIMTLLPVVSVLGLLEGCFFYYGYALPNTFYAKIVNREYFFHEGLEYLSTYLNVENFYSLCLGILTLASFIVIVRSRKTVDSAVFYLLGAVTMWIGYIIYIGGDFMEFRLLVPILPLFYISCVTIIAESLNMENPLFWLFILLTALSANYQHSTFQSTKLVDSISKLNEYIRKKNTNWKLTGQKLHELFYTGSPHDILITTAAAGAIPYYSQLPALDMLGLNDRWVAMHGYDGYPMAGHRRKAPLWYMAERQVNLIIDVVHFVCIGDEHQEKKIPFGYAPLPILLIPLQNNCYFIGYYLTKHPRIEELLKQGVIKQQPRLEQDQD